MFCCTLLYVHSSIAIILMGKKGLVEFSLGIAQEQLTQLSTDKSKMNDSLLYMQSQSMRNNLIFKAAYSVTFDLLILKIMFLFFKNAVKILKFR